nr:hypothetical protein [Tanacetum cinerariifolium]
MFKVSIILEDDSAELVSGRANVLGIKCITLSTAKGSVYTAKLSPKTRNSVSEDISNEVKESPDALLVKELVLDDKLEKKTISPTVAKREFVRPKQQEKPVRKLVKYAEMYRSQGWLQLPSNRKGGNWDNYTMVHYNSSTKKAYPNAHRNMVPRAVLIKTGLKPLNTVRPVNIAHPKPTVHNARPMLRFSKITPSTVRRPKAVNTARPKAVNTARLSPAVVNAVRANQVNVVKASACWVWRPTKPNASITLKRHNYIDGHPQKVQEDQGYFFLSLFEYFVGSLETATVRTVDNEEQEITATVYGKEFTVTEASVRTHLQLADADVTTVGASMPVSTTGMVQEVNISIPSPVTVKDKDAEQASGNINRTQSTAMPNVPLPQEISTYGSPKCQEAMKGSVAHTRSGRVRTPSYDSPLLGVHTPGSDEERFEQHELMSNVQQHSNDPPLLRGHTLGSGEDIIELVKELMETCTKLSERVLALEYSKTAQDLVITRSMIEEINQDAGVTLVKIDAEDQGRFDDETDFNAGFYKVYVTPTQVSAQGEAHSQEAQPENQLGILITGSGEIVLLVGCLVLLKNQLLLLVHQCQLVQQTATVRTVDNEEQEITATVYGKEFTVTEASVRTHLQLADADEPIPNIVSSSHQKTQTPRKALNKVTELPQTSEPIPNVADEAIYEEWDDRVERAVTTTASLDAEQASGNINRTQSTAMPNVPLP